MRLVVILKTPDITILVHCNDVKLADVVLSDTICGSDTWNDKWSREMTGIKFKSADSASDFYSFNKPLIAGTFKALTI